MDDYRAATLLRTLVADEPPPSRVDPRRAIAGVKRRRRRNRIAGLTSGAFVVALGLVLALLPTLRNDEPTSVAAAPAEFNPSPRHVFDPTRFALELTWRPEGVVAEEHESATTYQRITLLGKGNAPLATLSINGTGQVLPSEEWPSTNAASIYGDGNPSHWLRPDPKSDRAGELWWFWGPTAWAVVKIYDSSDPVELAVRLAKALRTTGNTPVRMPFTVPAPGGLKLARAATMTGPDGRYAGVLKFSSDGRWLYGSWVTVSATNDQDAVRSSTPYVLAGDDEHDSGATNTVPDDAAVVRPTTKDVVGVVPVAVTGSGPVIEPDVARRAASTVKLVDDPGDPNNWKRPFVG
ncbi:hypothetical protein [Cryptosporangium arvum]|uniref:hypothetical protein n=1 Tax=Cryptosporangium arvum TaxID=80871 RepID=UPI0004BB728C|nr:hypothetical protein [Cryptosporangium arvum]